MLRKFCMRNGCADCNVWLRVMGYESNRETETKCLFRQNTYLQNKKHTLTCQGGLVVTDLITSPVVSWEGWETPPPPQHRGSAVILCSTTGVGRPLCSCGDLLAVVC